MPDNTPKSICSDDEFKATVRSAIDRNRGVLDALAAVDKGDYAVAALILGIDEAEVRRIAGDV